LAFARTHFDHFAKQREGVKRNLLPGVDEIKVVFAHFLYFRHNILIGGKRHFALPLTWRPTGVCRIISYSPNRQMFPALVRNCAHAATRGWSMFFSLIKNRVNL